MEKIKQLEKRERRELAVPEILVMEEPWGQLLSVILKIKFSDWGDSNSKFKSELQSFVENNPLPAEIDNFFEVNNIFQNFGIDEETLYWLAITHDHPERTDSIFSAIAKYKPKINQPEVLRDELFAILEQFNSVFAGTSLAVALAEETKSDKLKKEKLIPEIKGGFEDLINFFKPNNLTLKEIILLPTDPFWKTDSGAAIVCNEQLLIKNHIDNRDNLEHEFLHSLINPIVEKIFFSLSLEQQEKILELANLKLKNDYGEYPFSLLCEEIIRTYNDVYKKGIKPQTFETFIGKIKFIAPEQFDVFYNENLNFRQRCVEFNIVSLENFLANARQYYEKYEQNRLRDLLFPIFQDYEAQSEDNFEQFLSQRLPFVLN